MPPLCSNRRRKWEQNHAALLRWAVVVVPVILGWATRPVHLLLVVLGWAALLLQPLVMFGWPTPPPPPCRAELGRTPPPPPRRAVFGLHSSSNSSSCCYHISVGERAVRRKDENEMVVRFVTHRVGYLPSSPSSPPPSSLLCHPPDSPVVASAFVVAVMFPGPRE